MSYNGILVIDKPKGIGSTDVVRIVKRKLKQTSVGHAGTLDFLATGVLVVCLGRATKLIEYLQREEKTYVAGIQFGIETDTYDIEGAVLNNSDVAIGKVDIDNIIYNFIGEIEQIPPMYSALKIKGERLYNLARQGIEVERKARKVNIKSLELFSFDEISQTAEILSTVGSGTYIRSLIYDLGKAVGTYATMTSLRRLKCSGYEIKEAIQINDDVDSEYLINNIIPMEKIRISMDSINVDDREKDSLLNGMTTLLSRDYEDGEYKVFNNHEIIGIGKISRSSKGTYLKLSKHLKEHENN